MGKKSRRQRIAVKHSSNSSNGDENKNKSASNKWTTSSEEELADCVRRIFNKFDFDSVGVMNLETALALESEVLDALTEISKQSRRTENGKKVVVWSRWTLSASVYTDD
jgi:hypothetical protein